MRRSDFSYHLPPELIAQHPPEERAAGRMLWVDGKNGWFEDRMFRELPDRLRPGDVLVFNDTRVIPARLFGEKATGGKIEVLVERITGPRTALAHCRAAKALKPGGRLLLEGRVAMRCTGRQGDLFALALLGEGEFIEVLQAHGRIPLPPYIQRQADAGDRDRYQTTYARNPGAVAAPTAGLHFEPSTFEALERRGVETVYVTLHVGAGTFQPVRAEDIRDHAMHAEWLEVDESACERINRARAEGRRVVAVGTTSVRCLETAGRDGVLKPYRGETDIFITPGYRFRVVDALFTNFHLPESTLLMLVSAFAGYDNVMAAYRYAVERRYRFFSYGDAMFLASRVR